METITAPAPTELLAMPDDLSAETLSSAAIWQEIDALPGMDRVTPEQLEQAHTIGRSALKSVGIRLITEGIGGVVDAGLIGAGKAGVDFLNNVMLREITATAPEVAALDKLLPHAHAESSEVAPTRLRKVGRKVTDLGIGVATAVTAQKVGIAAAEQVHHGLNHGLGEYLVPITSKVPALMGLSALRNRRAAKRQAKIAA